MTGAAMSAWMADGKDVAGPSKTAGTGAEWRNLGIDPRIVKSLVLSGFKKPTPIQRQTLPLALSSPVRDILGMARTGSGKTLAYVIPLLQRLGSDHIPGRGVRGLVFCPTRELAIQVMKVGKDMARISRKTRGDGALPLRWSMIIGGTSMEDQWEAMSGHPDILVATPGRFLHLIVEMKMDLSSTEVVVFDEADRLFEMGFATHVQEIVARLPQTRQNLLFSATLPVLVAEFAKASLTNPCLVRLDAETSISPDLHLSFLYIKDYEKDAALITILQRLLRPDTAHDSGDGEPARTKPQAIVFCATKHHVEYLNALLSFLEYSVSYAYGSLDQAARQIQLKNFRDRKTELLVATDVAARGLDIPIMDHVINYDHTPNPRVFVHRVGRTARAGRSGSAISLITYNDFPYLVDLQDLLGLPIVQPNSPYLGLIPRNLLESSSASLRRTQELLLYEARELAPLRELMRKSELLYVKSKAKASLQSWRTTKAFLSQTDDLPISVHPMFVEDNIEDNAEDDLSARREGMLKALHNYRPKRTILEMESKGDRGKDIKAMMERQRVLLKEKASTASITKQRNDGTSQASTGGKQHQDPDYYMDYERKGSQKEKAYSMGNASFDQHLRSSTFDMASDETMQSGIIQKASQLKWNRQKKRFMKEPSNGGANDKMIRTESGALLPASFSSGRYDAWKAKRGRSGPVGESSDGTGVVRGLARRGRGGKTASGSVSRDVGVDGGKQSTSMDPRRGTLKSRGAKSKRGKNRR